MTISKLSPVTLDDMRSLAEKHNLVSVSCAYLAEIKKYSFDIQWMNSGFREISNCIDADPRKAMAEAMAGKDVTDKALRVDQLRRELASLTGDAA